jgi:thioredoxin-related protein
MNSDTEQEIVATGELYKQSSSGSKTWALRTISLASVYLMYYTKDGKLKGQVDISGCKVNLMTAEDLGSKNAKYAFSIEGGKKKYIFCASNEKNRVAWMMLLNEQIEENRDIIRKYLKTGEELHANQLVNKKNTLFSSKVRFVVTNFPRILFIDAKTNKLLEVLSWDRAAPPVLVVVCFHAYLMR